MIAAHRKIGDAIIAGDADDAIRSMTVHLEATRDYVARYYPAIIDNPVILVSGVSRLRVSWTGRLPSPRLLASPGTRRGKARRPR
jgi:hypothetical protein